MECDKAQEDGQPAVSGVLFRRLVDAILFCLAEQTLKAQGYV
jgi:hypothetical protein